MFQFSFKRSMARYGHWKFLHGLYPIRRRISYRHLSAENVSVIYEGSTPKFKVNFKEKWRQECHPYRLSFTQQKEMF